MLRSGHVRTALQVIFAKNERFGGRQDCAKSVEYQTWYKVANEVVDVVVDNLVDRVSFGKRKFVM